MVTKKVKRKPKRKNKYYYTEEEESLGMKDGSWREIQRENSKKKLMSRGKKLLKDRMSDAEYYQQNVETSQEKERPKEKPRTKEEKKYKRGLFGKGRYIFTPSDLKLKRHAEISTLKTKTGKISEAASAGVKTEHLKRRDWLLGRKVATPKAITDKGGKINSQKLDNWRKEHPEEYEKWTNQRTRHEMHKARGEKLKNFGSRIGGKGSWIRRHTSKEAQLGTAKGTLEATTKTIKRFGTATHNIGEALSESAQHSIGPIQVFQLAFQRMSIALKWLIIIVFLLVILFVPWGIFYYTGWAVAAAFMFLIALIYWVFISFFRAIASVLVTLINMISRIIMNVLIYVVEALLSFFTGVDSDVKKWVPDPVWASKFEPSEAVPTPWDHPEFSSRSIQVPFNYWYDGRVLLEGSLIHFEQLANVPSLMIVSPPNWQSWMYDILIVKLLEKIPGFNVLGNAYNEIIGDGMAVAAANFVETSPPWLVIFVGCLPVIIIAIVILVIYFKYKREAQLR